MTLNYPERAVVEAWPKRQGCHRNSGHLCAVVMGMMSRFRTARDVPGSPAGRGKPVRSVAVLAASAAAGVLLGACIGSPGSIPASPSAPAAPASASHPAAVSSPPGVASVFGQPLLMPQVAATAAGLYVAWQVSRPGDAVQSELARVDAATGRVEAARYLGAAFEQAIVAAGALWVATATGSTPAATMLLRLNPDTLQLTGRWQVETGGAPNWAAQVLVVAGGGLWVVGGDRLLHLSLPGGTIIASIALPGAASSDLSANAAGTVLVVGEADSGGRGEPVRVELAVGVLRQRAGGRGRADRRGAVRARDQGPGRAAAGRPGGASGLFGTAQQLGGAVGVALLGTVFFGYLNGHSFEAAIVHTAPYAMGAFALCAVLSMLLPRTAVSEETLTEF